MSTNTDETGYCPSPVQVELQQLREENERLKEANEKRGESLMRLAEKVTYLNGKAAELAEVSESRLAKEIEIADHWRSIVAGHVIKNGHLENEVEKWKESAENNLLHVIQARDLISEKDRLLHKVLVSLENEGNLRYLLSIEETIEEALNMTQVNQMKCTVCHETKHVNLFDTPDICSLCVAKSEIDRLSREAAEMKQAAQYIADILAEKRYSNDSMIDAGCTAFISMERWAARIVSTTVGIGYVKREEVRPLLDVLEKVSKWGGCNGFDNPGMGSGLPCVWKGCYAYHSDDPNEYCLPCEANNALINFAQAELERTKTTELK